MQRVFDVIGSPLIALLAAVLVGIFTLGMPAGFSKERISSLVEKGLAPIAGILLIVGAGGGFKQTLIDTGVGQMVLDISEDWSIPALLLAWLIAVVIRLATGSATVATVSAAGLVAPLAADMSTTHAALLVLAIGAGSLFFSHVNDAGFWLVKEYFGLNVGQTIKTWSDHGDDHLGGRGCAGAPAVPDHLAAPCPVQPRPARVGPRPLRRPGPVRMRGQVPRQEDAALSSWNADSWRRASWSGVPGAPFPCPGRRRRPCGRRRRAGPASALLAARGEGVERVHPGGASRAVADRRGDRSTAALADCRGGCWALALLLTLCAGRFRLHLGPALLALAAGLVYERYRTR
ncbi:hypothetical protein STENM223S_02419 [Streptomyces tendae]